MPRSCRTALAATALLLAPSCSDGGMSVPAVGEVTAPRQPGARTGGGDADGLAASLLLAAGLPVPHPGRPVAPVADPDLAAELSFLARNHLEAAALGSGAGALLLGSRRIRRLALAPSAPPDANGRFGNLDETLEAERLRLARAAGGEPPAGTADLLFPWRDGTAELAAEPGPALRTNPEQWRTVPAARGEVDLAQVGRAIRGRLELAGPLLRDSRGALVGVSTSEGVLGLQLLHQALAAEDSLVGNLFFDGRMLGELREPASYDPASGLRWLPASFAVAEDPPGSGVATSFVPGDGASSLLANAELMLAAAELAWLASDDNPDPDLRDLFRGFPFGDPGGPVRPRPIQEGGGLNFVEDIQPLINFRCSGCHGFTPGSGGFTTTSLQTIQMGGNRSRALGLPMIVPFDHARSVLWQVLTPTPPPGFQRMPQGSMLPPGEISLIADWIDQGAVENPIAVPPPPAPGRDLAVVLFRNLVAMHLDRDTFFLHHRHEGDFPSGVATAVATGRALEALAVLAAVDPDLEQDGLGIGAVIAGVARAAADGLLDADGRAREYTGGAATGAAPPADLAGQAALVSGLLAASPWLAADRRVLDRTGNALARLLEFRGPDGLFRNRPQFAGAVYRPATLDFLLGALLRGRAAGSTAAAAARADFLRRLLPVLAYAEWDGRGEVLGDGLPDTDGDGLPEPALAGEGFGRLPLLAGEIRAGPDRALPPPSERVTWSRHIKPLFLQKCAQCHLGGNRRGDYSLETPASLRQPGESGGRFPLLVPGDPEGSLLFTKVARRRPPVGAQMPLALPPLNGRGVALLRAWIEQGASGR